MIEEVKFFHDYAHHVATGDHVGNVLKRIYVIPEEQVHIIGNGVDEEYMPDSSWGEDFRRKVGVLRNETLVIGMAGRLVKDTGHLLMFEVLKQVFMESESFRESRSFGEVPTVSLDVFLNPTPTAQGLDHTFIEAMLSGVPIMGTRFASVTGSLDREFRYRRHILTDYRFAQEVSVQRSWRTGKKSSRRKASSPETEHNSFSLP